MKLNPWEPDVRTIVDRINSGDIDLQPDFQRQEVWSRKKKKKLIDTIIREWSIPPIHLVQSPDNRLEVLDGQQRLSSILDFFNNRFSIDGNITPYDEQVSSLHGVFYKKLDSFDRRRFDQYTIRCFRITDYAPEEPSELFYRLNQPTILTSGEQRNALFGPAREQLKEVVLSFVDRGNNKQSLGFSNNRLAYDDIFARVLYFVEQGHFGVKSTEARISERFREKRPFSSEVVERVKHASHLFSTMREQAPGHRFNKASLQSFIMFFSRRREFCEGDVSTYLVRIIEQKSNESGWGRALYEVFEDRSSLRVTDVSSVVFRDFVLSLFYDEFYRPAHTSSYERALYDDVKARLSSGLGSSESEGVVSELVDIDRWSASL